MTRYVHGLTILGLSYGSSTEATLFTDYPIDASTLPSINPLSSSTQIIPIMLPAGIRGASARVGDLRDPLITASTPQAMLQDDTAGTLSALLCVDPGWANTTRWSLPAVVRLEHNTTSIILSGTTAPTVNQLIWIGPECLKVTAVSTSNFAHTCTVSRAQCGSRSMAHEINPDAYPPGDNGSRETLIAYSRQPFDGDRRIEAALFQFKMKESDPCAVESCTFAWVGHLSNRPTCDQDFVWSVPVQHLAKTIADSTFPGEGTLELSYCIEVTERKKYNQNIAGQSDIFRDLPQSVLFRFTPYEFDKLFNAPVHAPQNTLTGTNLSALNTKIFGATGDSKVSYHVKGEVGGHSYVWKLTSIDNTDAGQELIKVRGTLLSSSEASSISDSPVTYQAGYGFLTPRNQGLNAGFLLDLLLSGPLIGEDLADLYNEPREYRVRTVLGEAAPKVELRVQIKDTFPGAALRLLLADKGGNINHASRDTIVGSRGIGTTSNWVNIGSAPAGGLDPSQGTQEFNSLNALLSNVYTYTFKPGDKIGDWFRNELALHNAIMTFVPTTGKVGARVWARPISGAVALSPVHYPVIEVVTDETLKEVRAIFIERGIDPITLQAKFRKPLQLPETRARDYQSAVTYRIWANGGAINDSELQSGPLSKLVQASFGVGLGSPRVFKIPLLADASIQFGDQVTWTDNTIPTPTGRGFSTRKMFVLGIDVNAPDGIKYAICLEDVVNQEVTAVATAGEVATGALVVGIASLDETNRVAVVTVDAIHRAQGFDITTSDSALWNGIKTAGALVHVTNPYSHNVEGNNELPGHLEAYATLTDVLYNSKSKQSYLTLTFAAAWLTTRGLTLASLIKLRKTMIGLPTARSATATPTSTAVAPILNQSYNGGSGSDRLHLSPLSRRPRFDNRLSLVG